MTDTIRPDAPTPHNPIFALFRSLLQRSLQPLPGAATKVPKCSEARANARTLAQQSNNATHQSTPCTGQASPSALRIIKRFEGCARLREDGHVEAYPDPGTGGAPWTIGWGATGKGIGPDTVWTQFECDQRLERDVARFAKGVWHALSGKPVTQNQFDAMVSFHYNTGAIARSTLLKKHLAGDYDGAASEFARWNRAGGRALKGLTRRRAAEAALYRSK